MKEIMADRVADVSTHSRPKAAALLPSGKVVFMMFQHTAARRRLFWVDPHSCGRRRFQHTAARRRLKISFLKSKHIRLFQHTAARRRLRLYPQVRASGASFNTQPPEGGCGSSRRLSPLRVCFNTQPPEGGCLIPAQTRHTPKFQHTAARRRLRIRLY